MFEATPLLIILVVILSGLIGGVIGSMLSRVSYEAKKKEAESTHTFHVDGATGIVSDITSIKYHR